MTPSNVKPGGATPSGRLRGGWLWAARAVWVMVAATTLGLFALSVPAGYALLRTVCTRRPCGPEQLTPEGARAIDGLGLSLDLYAAYNVALVVFFALAFCAVAAAMFWRRSDDLMALFTSLTLVLSGVFLPEWMELLVPIYPYVWLVLDLLNSATYCCLFILLYEAARRDGSRQVRRRPRRSGAGDGAAGARLVVAETHQKVVNRQKFFVSVLS